MFSFFFFFCSNQSKKKKTSLSLFNLVFFIFFFKFIQKNVRRAPGHPGALQFYYENCW